MHKRTTPFVLVFMFVLTQIAWASQVIHLKTGTNEVSFRVYNDLSVDIENLSLMVDQEDLPEGITIRFNTEVIQAAAKQKSEHGLQLYIHVAEGIPEGNYKIPFTVSNEAGQSWDFVFDAELKFNIPETYSLMQNYPNPFNPETFIDYQLADLHEQQTSLVIYNTLGEKIKTLVDKKQSAGTYRVIWDGKNESGQPVVSGVYFYEIHSGSFNKIRKMMLIK